MKKQIIIIPLTIFALCTLTNCSNNHISRKTFKDTDFNNALSIYKSMEEKRESQFLENATTKIKYSVKMDGSFRFDYLSFHNFNFDFSAGYSISWSCKDNYLKIEGEKEVYYYMILNENEWWKFEEYEKYNGHKKQKYKLEDQEVVFMDLVSDTINDFSSVYIPGCFHIGVGIDGYVPVLPYPVITNIAFSPYCLFDEEEYKSIEAKKEEYKTEDKGYSIDIKYGSDDENTISSTLQGKVKSMDLPGGSDRLAGYFNLDLFASYKNNFISQAEYIISGNQGNTRTNDFNVDVNFYLSEEVEQGNCTIDTLVPDDYETIII